MLINPTKLGRVSRLLRRAFRSYARIFVVLTLLGLLAGLAEGLGIAAVIPLFSVVTGQTVEGADTVSRIVVGFFTTLGVPVNAPAVLGFIVFLFIGKAFTLFFARYQNARIVSTFEQDTRRTLFRRTMRANWPFILKQPSGYLESILLYDVERGSIILNVLSNIVIIGTTFAAYTAIAVSISVPITVATVAIGSLIFLLLKPVFFRIRRLLSEALDAQKGLNHHVAEHMLSAKSIKAMGLESAVITRAFALFSRLRRSKIRAALYRQLSLAFIEPLGFVVIAALFLFSYRQPGFSIVSFGIIMFLVQRMFGYVQSLSGQVQSINEFYPYLRAVMQWRRVSRAHAEQDTGTKPFALEQDVEFRDVTFGYRPDRTVLDHCSFVVGQGELVGIVGPSGVGKTTVVDLLLRLLDPQGGHILIDGNDVRDIQLHAWRKHIGYVAQDALLLNASVRENIRFYSDMSDEQIETAARQANIHDTIMSLPDGYDAPVGERGVNLSGGQRQRIVLARALARKPDILILDEATSAIDAESEELIRKSIAALRGRTTVIAITHNLATAEYLDRLLVLENGGIQEEGTPQELLDRADSYLARLSASEE